MLVFVASGGFILNRLFRWFVAVSAAFALLAGFSFADEIKVDLDGKALNTSIVSESDTPLAVRAEELFWSRSWKELADLAKPENRPDARTLSLAANGLWQQRKWGEALKLMELADGGYPEGVEPYARLLKVLALERTERRQEAYTAAVNLYRSSQNFPLVRYYAMYTLFRLTSSTDEKEKWLRRMYASPRGSRTTVLKELAAVGRMTPSDALALLKVSPQNSTARKIVESGPDSPEKFYRLGYSAYLRGDNETAVKWLSRLKLNEPFGESGTYYLGYALQRLNRSPEAEPLFVSLVYKEGTDYMVRAMFRLRLMFGGKAHDAALAALLKMTESSNHEIAHQALYSLAVSRWKNASQARDEYLEKYPDGSRAPELRWEKGWAEYKSGNYKGALSVWKTAKNRTAQLLYWMSKANEKLGHSEEAESQRKQLIKTFPLSIYAFWVQPEGPFKVVDASWPESFFTPRGELERWGFVSHAQMELEGKKDIISCVRRARIARWMGNDWQVFKELRRFGESMLSGNELPSWLMKLLYPRPFKSIVEAEGRKWGVDPLFIWSTMRLESGFNPGASNWIGANGLMQMMPATASSEAKKMGLKKYSLFNPKDSISMAASHISGLMSRFDGRMQCVSGAYNAGAGSVKNWNEDRGSWDDDMWIESIPFAETNGYVKTVMLNYSIYKKLYGDEYKKAVPVAEAEAQTSE